MTEEETYNETFWARQRKLLKEKDKFIDFGEMTAEKLKTLKDLSSVGMDDNDKLKYVSYDCLKEEANNWIEELTRQHHQLNDGYETTLERNFESNRGCSISDNGGICDICHTLRWIEMFFGLKEK